MSCPDCFKGSIHAYAEPKGREETLHGVRTYIAAGLAEGTTSSASTVVFITDAFGFNLVNSKLLADDYAARTGFRVLVPDIIPGGGVPAYSLELMSAASAPVGLLDIPGQLWRIASVVRMMSIFIPFMLRTRGAFPAILAYVRAVKADMPSDTKLGVAGFCWGGLQATKLSAEPSVEGGAEPLVAANFMAHPSGLKVPIDYVDAATKFHVPLSIALGDKDMMLSKENAALLEAELRREYAGSEGRLEVALYENAGHGFAVRADKAKNEEDEAAGKAATQAVNFFKKYLV
jgi:dienelactone hydrolase